MICWIVSKRTKKIVFEDDDDKKGGKKIDGKYGARYWLPFGGIILACAGTAHCNHKVPAFSATKASDMTPVNTHSETFNTIGTINLTSHRSSHYR